jgi:tRNA 2-selenouridine synthase
MLFKLANLSQLDAFDSILDARTPAEYLLDHVPNATNVPTLNNEERIVVGTIYKQVSAFEAKKRGAAIAARNIAMHIENSFMDKPKNWKPLVYCWRGGNRSGSMVTILRAIGWQAQQLEGGHKAYRKLVVESLESLPMQYDFNVIGGATGSGKSALLSELAKQGAQVLDLETLALHRGSVLGRFADIAQPTQKWFDSQLAHVLRRFDASKPVFVEAESKKIGRISLPETLMSAIRSAPIWTVEAPIASRVDYLLQDYAEYVAYPDRLKQQLSYLLPVFGHAKLNSWYERIDTGNFADITEALLLEHYDPLYQHALDRQTETRPPSQALILSDLSPATLKRTAAKLICENSSDFH